MFSKAYCPYCVKAKLLLEQLGQQVIEHKIDESDALFDDLRTRLPHARTVPQIFINDTPIGGCDELYAMHEKGELEALLQA